MDVGESTLDVDEQTVGETTVILYSLYMTELQEITIRKSLPVQRNVIFNSGVRDKPLHNVAIR